MLHNMFEWLQQHKATTVLLPELQRILKIDFSKIWALLTITYRTRANKGRSWIVAAPRKLPKIGVF